MSSTQRLLSPGLFALTLVAFFLPFVSVSCQGRKLVQLSGIQLATGASIKPTDIFRPDDLRPLLAGGQFTLKAPSAGAAGGERPVAPSGDPTQLFKLMDEGRPAKLAPNGWAILALALALVGLGVAALSANKLGSWPALLASAGTGVMLLLRALGDSHVKETPLMFLQVNYELGFWLALGAFAVNAGLNWFAVAQANQLQPMRAPLTSRAGSPGRAHVSRAYPSFDDPPAAEPPQPAAVSQPTSQPGSFRPAGGWGGEA